MRGGWASLKDRLAFDGQRVAGGNCQVGGLCELHRPGASPRRDDHDDGCIHESPFGNRRGLVWEQRSQPGDTPMTNKIHANTYDTIHQ